MTPRRAKCRVCQADMRGLGICGACSKSLMKLLASVRDDRGVHTWAALTWAARRARAFERKRQKGKK
jgi:hypothetical protein